MVDNVAAGMEAEETVGEELSEVATSKTLIISRSMKGPVVD